MAKRNPRKTLENKLDKLCREVIRIRDNKTCQKCGKGYDKMDCSHVIPRGNKRLRWDLKNLKQLCSRCHIWWWHDSPLEARRWFKDKFPDRYQYLMHEFAKGPKKWSLQELEEHIEYLEDMKEYYKGITEDLPF